MTQSEHWPKEARSFYNIVSLLQFAILVNFHNSKHCDKNLACVTFFHQRWYLSSDWDEPSYQNKAGDVPVRTQYFIQGRLHVLQTRCELPEKLELRWFRALRPAFLKTAFQPKTLYVPKSYKEICRMVWLIHQNTLHAPSSDWRMKLAKTVEVCKSCMSVGPRMLRNFYMTT